MRNKKLLFTLRTTAVTLIAAMVITLLPTEGAGFWAKASDGSEVKEVYIVDELTELRTENSKTYLKSDGSRSAVFSSGALHYEENGTWKDIDNTFETVNKNGEEYYKNTAAPVDVLLPAELDEDKGITVEKDGYSVTVSPAEVTKSASGKKAKLPKKATEKQKKEMDASALAQETVTTNNIVYSDVYDNTDIQYDVQPNGVKESIVLNKKPNKHTKYTYTVEADGLEAELKEDNSIDFYYTTENEKTVVFTMPTPYMFDSNNVYSYDIEVELEKNKNGEYELTYTPDYNWLKDKERVYPVTVDPTIESAEYIYLQNVYTISGLPSTAFYESRIRIGTFGYPNPQKPSDYSGYITTPDLSLLGTNNIITSARLNLSYMGSSYQPEKMTIGVFDVLDNYFFTSNITYETRPKTAEEPIDVATVGVGDDVCFNITEYAQNWYRNGGYYGVNISRIDNGSKLMFFDYNNFYYEIDYKLISGKYSTDEELDLGDAGTVYINNHTGHTKIIRNDIGVDGNVMPVNISMIYDVTQIHHGNDPLWPCLGSVCITSSAYGRGYRLNYSQQIEYFAPESGTPYYRYIAEDGNSYYFEQKETVSENVTIITYEDETDSGYTLEANPLATQDYTLVTIKDSSGQRYYFDSFGRLIKIVSPEKISENVTQSSTASEELGYEPGVISIKYILPTSKNLVIDTITDGAGRIYKFRYHNDSGIITAIEYLGYGDTPLKTVTYSSAFRSDACLEEVVGVDNDTAKYYYNGWVDPNWNESHKLTSVINGEGSRYEFEYDGYAVSRITEYAPDGTVGEDISIEYGYNETRYYKTADYISGNTEIPYKALQFNSDGDITSCFVYDKDSDGIYKINVNYKMSDSSTSAPNKLINLTYSDNLSEDLFKNTAIYDGWTLSNTNSGILSDKGINNGNAISLKGDVAADSTSEKTFAVSGAAEQEYTLAFWAKSPLYSSKDNSKFAADIVFLNADGEEISESDVEVELNNHISGWQYVTKVVSCPEDFSSVKLTLSNNYRYPDAMFCDFALYREAYGYNYYYNDNGELDRIEEIAAPKTEEDTEEDTTKEETEEETEDTDPFSDESVSEMGIKSVTKYDVFGNVLESLITNNRASISEKSAYTSNGNYLASTTDALGNTTHYNYNPELGTLDSVTDANGNTTSYTYDAVGTVTGMSQSVSGLENGDSLSVSYTYDSGDRVRTINHNNFNYTFNYDPFGVLSSVKAADKTIVSYAYDEDYLPTSTTYGNEQTIYYTYDSNEQLVGISTSPDEIDRQSFAYDHSGNLTMIYDIVNHRRTNLTYDSEGNVYTTVRNTLNGVVKHEYKTIADVYTETVGNKTYAMTYAYDADGRLTTLTWNNGDTTAKKEIHYDDLDRQTASVISAKTGEETVQILNTTYAYNDTVNFGTSNQVSVLQNKANGYSNTIAYEYDKNGNIVKAGDVSYSYDEAGQLTRVNDPQYGTTVYVYDVGGNIKYVKSYDYTTGELGTPTGTITYGYTDEWKDLLTSYNGQTITYDGAGNPLSYRDGMQFTWEMGRQLASSTHNGVTYSYKYDTDGLRTEKTDGLVTTSYTWADGQLTHQNDGTNEIYFRYDDSGEVIAFNLNGTDYYYAKNLQGDIIAILDGNGECMVKYTYDAWGKILNIEDNSNINLGTINPLRYRGYYYDIETGLYYLQSRYYDATVGRFVNADDISYLGATGTALSHNLFAYCENSCINGYDLDGNVTIIIRRWMVSSVADLILSFIPVVKVIYAPVSSIAKAVGKSFFKTSWNRTMLKFFEGFKSVVYKISSKLWNLAYKVKYLRKLFCNGPSTKLAENWFGWVFSKNVTNFLNAAFKNADIFMSFGGLIAGLIDWVYDKKINNVLGKIKI